MRYLPFTGAAIAAVLIAVLISIVNQQLAIVDDEVSMLANEVSLLESTINEAEGSVRQMESKQRNGWQDFDAEQAVEISNKIQQQKLMLAANREQLATAQERLDGLVAGRIHQLRLLYIPLGALLLGSVVIAAMTFPRRKQVKRR